MIRRGAPAAAGKRERKCPSSEIGASVGVSYTENYAGEPPSNPASPPSEDGEPRLQKGGMWKPGERPTTIESVSDDEHE